MGVTDILLALIKTELIRVLNTEKFQAGARQTYKDLLALAEIPFRRLSHRDSNVPSTFMGNKKKMRRSRQILAPA